MKTTENFTKNKISSEAIIKDAVELLQECKMKMIVIVDSDNKVVGTITDGDIRRGLLNNISLTNKCSSIMNRNPRCALDSDSVLINELLTKNKLSVVIVDKENRFIGIESSIRVGKAISKKNTVVIMAGGEGKRMMPLTLSTPKPLLYIKDKPILHKIIDSLSAHGFSNIIISVRYKADDIKNYFEDGKKFNVNINYIEEKDPLGTAGSLSLLENKIEGPIIVMNGDLMTSINYEQLLDFHQKSNKSITLCTVNYDILIPFGTIRLNDSELIKVEEKPVKSYLINAGIYVIEENVVSKMEKGVPIDMTSLIDKYIEKKSVSVFPLHEHWLDIGNPENLKKAQEIE
jgi:dTDP-glucose pyrophosphorylase